MSGHHTKPQDRLAAARRRLPRQSVEDRYRFETPAGPASLSDRFEGRAQLVVHHHMLRPSDPDPRSGCSMFADGFGLSVFRSEGETIYRTYFTNGRDVEFLGSVWSFLDITPYGRQETWEDAPALTPQGTPHQWWRLHDEYGFDAGECCGR